MTTDRDTPTGTTSRSTAAGVPSCPFCGSEAVDRELAFGSALSKSQYSCRDCDTVFERIRWEARRPETRGQDNTSIDPDESSQESVRLWMVERTYSKDSPNIIVITYATRDGRQQLRKEWAFNRYGTDTTPDVTAAIEADPERLAPVDDEDTRRRYAQEADRMADRHDPADTV